MTSAIKSSVLLVLDAGLGGRGRGALQTAHTNSADKMPILEYMTTQGPPMPPITSYKLQGAVCFWAGRGRGRGRVLALPRVDRSPGSRLKADRVGGAECEAGGWAGLGWAGVRGHTDDGGQGSSYSGKVSSATSGFILKYWLKRRTAYPRKSKSMVENLA